MSNDDVIKRFKPVWSLQLALDQNIDQQGGNRVFTIAQLANRTNQLPNHPQDTRP